MSSRIIQLENIQFDGWTAAFGFAAGLLTMLLFGLVPALLALRTEIGNRVRGSAVGTSQSAGGQGGFDWLVIGQVAVALILVVQAGLFVQTLGKLEAVDPGFMPQNVLVGAMMVTGSRYERPEQGWARLIHLRSVPLNLAQITSSSGAAVGPGSSPGSTRQTRSSAHSLRPEDADDRLPDSGGGPGAPLLPALNPEKHFSLALDTPLRGS